MSDAPTLARAVIETLTEVRDRDGDGAAYQFAAGNIEASTIFLVNA
jgi:hypothetical protein